MKNMKKLVKVLALLAMVAGLSVLVGCWNKADSEDVSTDAAVEDGVYVSPIDFDALEAENPDVYAWVSVTGTDISYPVYQSAIDDTYYMDHNRASEDDVMGEIFSESAYTAQDFSDAHTVLYGHTTFSGEGEMFSELVAFADSDFFAANQEIIVYLPTEELHYEIFAFYKWSDEHLLANYETEDADLFQSYLTKVLSIGSTSSNIDSDTALTSADKILTLSTCVELGGSERYLLQAVLVS